MAETTVSTGVALLDEVMEGFQTGDNVILEVDVATPPQPFLHAFMAAALARGERVVYVSFDRSPATIVESLASLPRGDLVVLDAFTEGKGRGERVFRAFYESRPPARREVVRIDFPRRPLAFHEDFDAAMGSGRGSFIVVDSLTGMQELWESEERVRAFYTHSCPRLFDTRAIAVWVLSRAVHSEEFRAGIGHVAQVVLRLEGDGPSLRVLRALGRKHSGEGVGYAEADGKVERR
ncbi:MAG TPA: hypothetical protein VNX21_04875 [Candidatus Thermoplasmatota archaeon]|nr:hypothetical protein [Candidatus Thermoplasmatota archaeon]